MQVTHQEGDVYHVTGVDLDGKRFKLTYSNPYWALAVNLYNGSVWQVRDGKRKRIKQVWN